MAAIPGNVEEMFRKAREICHDVNQPLTVVLARSELILMKMPPDDPNRKSLEQLREESVKISELVGRFQTLLKEFQAE